MRSNLGSRATRPHHRFLVCSDGHSTGRRKQSGCVVHRFFSFGSRVSIFGKTDAWRQTRFRAFARLPKAGGVGTRKTRPIAKRQTSLQQIQYHNCILDRHTLVSFHSFALGPSHILYFAVFTEERASGGSEPGGEAAGRSHVPALARAARISGHTLELRTRRTGVSVGRVTVASETFLTPRRDTGLVRASLGSDDGDRA